MRGLDNFNTRRTEYFRDATVELEAFKAGQIDFRDRERRQGMGHRLRLPCGAEGAGEEGTAAPPSADRHARLRHEHPPAAVQGCPGAARAGDGVRFRMGQRQPVLWRLYPHQELFQQQRTRLERHPGGRRTGVAEQISRPTAARPVHQAVRAAGHRRVRQQSRGIARRAGAAGAGRLESEGPQAGRRRWAAVQLRDPAGSAGVRARGAALRAMAGAAGDRRPRADRRSGAVSAADRHL